MSRRRNPRWELALAAVVLCAAALIARAFGSESGGHGASPPAPPTSSPGSAQSTR